MSEKQNKTYKELLSEMFRDIAVCEEIEREKKQKEEHEKYNKEFSLHYSQFSSKEMSFSAIRQNFESEDRLSLKARQLLKLIEARSYQNNGDTKWADESIIKETKWSRSTVHRTFVELEKHGFSMRLTKKGFNHSDRSFYSDRVIRCFRIILVCNCKIKSSVEIGWKTDPRPPFNPRFMRDINGECVSREWTHPSSEGMNINEILDRINAAGVATIDEDFREVLNFKRMYRDERALNILGMPPRKYVKKYNKYNNQRSLI